MAQPSTIQALPRQKLGSRDARKLRGQGRIPVVLMAAYGKPALPCSIDEHEFMTLRRSHVHLFEIEVGGEVEAALVRELHWDTYGDRLLHVDFKRIQRGVETEVDVELEFVGHPKAGYANHIFTHITVRTLPRNIPDSILVKLSHLEEGDHVRARDLELPEGVSLAVPEDLELVVIAGVHHAPEMTPEEMAAAEEAAAVAAAEKDKKEEEKKPE